MNDDEVRIVDPMDVYVTVDTEGALMIQGISDLIATLQHCGAHGDNALRMKDAKTGEIFAVSYLGKDEE